MNFIKSAKIRILRHKVAFAVLSALVLLLLLWRLHRPVPPATPRMLATIHPKATEVLWWATMPANYTTTRYCGNHMCTFHSRRQKLAAAKAVVFYGSDIKVDDFPLPRRNDQLWALLHEESPRNVPFMPHATWLQHFNITSTFSRYSDYPLTTYYLPKAVDLTSPTFHVPVGEKSRLRSAADLAPIAFMQSDCDTMSGRDDYVRELMRHIKIDSFGTCLHNRDLPKSLTEDYLNRLYSPELYRFLGRYKFILAYENGICNDYITEKFWRPLVIGSIPIYFGSPTIRDWEPNNKSVIHIDDFASPKALAEFITQLDSDDSEYNTYLDHKYEQLVPIANQRLQHELDTRDYSMVYDNIFGAFECFVCRRINEMPAKASTGEDTHMGMLSHYDCPMPLVYPAMELSGDKFTGDSIWKSVMSVGKCQAEILNQLFQLNVNYTKQKFDFLLNQRVEANQCN